MYFLIFICTFIIKLSNSYHFNRHRYQINSILKLTAKGGDYSINDAIHEISYWHVYTDSCGIIKQRRKMIPLKEFEFLQNISNLFVSDAIQLQSSKLKFLKLLPGNNTSTTNMLKSIYYIVLIVIYIYIL
jgi:hypothetical protein